MVAMVGSLALRRHALVGCAVLAAALCAIPASASAGTDARATFPTTVSAGATLTVTGRVTGRAPAARVELQHRAGGHWRARASHRRTPAGGRFTLRWRPPNATSRLVLRIAVVRGRRIVDVTRAYTVRIRPRRVAAPAPGAPAYALAPADTSSLPAEPASSPESSAPPPRGCARAPGSRSGSLGQPVRGPAPLGRSGRARRAGRALLSGGRPGRGRRADGQDRRNADGAVAGGLGGR